MPVDSVPVSRPFVPSKFITISRLHPGASGSSQRPAHLDGADAAATAESAPLKDIAVTSSCKALRRSGRSWRLATSVLRPWPSKGLRPRVSLFHCILSLDMTNSGLLRPLPLECKRNDLAIWQQTSEATRTMAPRSRACLGTIVAPASCTVQCFHNLLCKPMPPQSAAVGRTHKQSQAAATSAQHARL